MIMQAWPGSPIRTSLDQSSFSAPQSFSQNSTSFIASYCQGIHRLRLSSWPYNLSKLRLSLHSNFNVCSKILELIDPPLASTIQPDPLCFVAHILAYATLQSTSIKSSWIHLANYQQPLIACVSSNFYHIFNERLDIPDYIALVKTI